DEGLNTDSEYRLMRLAYGPREASLPGGIGFDLYSLAHAANASLRNLDPIRRFAWDFATGNHYGVNSYWKAGLFMAQLKHDLGARTFSRAQRAFFQEWSFRHPSTADFFDVFERVSGRDLSTYRKHIIEGTSRLDWSTILARTTRHKRDDGVFDRQEGRTTYEDGRRVKPDADKSKDRSKDGPYDTLVLFGNLGEWPHEAKARLVFEDGAVVDRTLPAEARWVRLTTTYRSKLAWAAVDPDRENAWDLNRSNDSIVLGTIKVKGKGKPGADTGGRAAAVKTFGWVSYLVGLFTQLAWAVA
ncbi:MAG: hypothetical protein ACRD1B_03555, partial [Thermoanaerobaculia bacterium]